MATWDELKEYLAATYQVEHDTGDRLTLLLSTSVGRTQYVHLHWFAPAGLVSLWSHIGSVDRIDPARLLALSEYSAWGVKQFGDKYSVVAHLPVTDLVVDEIEVPMTAVVMAADEYEHSLDLGDEN